MIASALAGLVTLALEWRERFEVARYRPRPRSARSSPAGRWPRSRTCCPRADGEEAAAPDATLTALLIAAMGMAVLVPSLVWLFRLALSGRLAYEEEPRP